MQRMDKREKMGTPSAEKLSRKEEITRATTKKNEEGKELQPEEESVVKEDEESQTSPLAGGFKKIFGGWMGKEKDNAVSSDPTTQTAVEAVEENPPAQRMDLLSWLKLQEQTPLEDIPVRMNVLWDELKRVKYLAKGGMARLYTAVYYGNTVVVKLPREDCLQPQHALKDLRTEIDTLSQLQHPHIVRFLGAGEKQAQGPEARTVPFMIMENLEKGNLTNYLGTGPEGIGEGWESLQRRHRRKKLSFLHRLGLAYELAEALNYLQNEGIPGSIVLHRDLKPDNVAFTTDGTLKLFDFGLSKVMKKRRRTSVVSAVYEMTGETGSLRYMAPEVALHQAYNGNADVYSWALVVWELMTCTRPFDSMTGIKEFFKRVINGNQRPNLEKNWPEDFCELLQKCWAKDLHERPTANELASLVKMMLRNELNHSEHEAKMAEAKELEQAGVSKSRILTLFSRKPRGNSFSETIFPQSSISSNKEGNECLETPKRRDVVRSLFGKPKPSKPKVARSLSVEMAFDPQVTIVAESLDPAPSRNGFIDFFKMEPRRRRKGSMTGDVLEEIESPSADDSGAENNQLEDHGSGPPRLTPQRIKEFFNFREEQQQPAIMEPVANEADNEEDGQKQPDETDPKKTPIRDFFNRQNRKSPSASPASSGKGEFNFQNAPALKDVKLDTSSSGKSKVEDKLALKKV